MSSTTGEERKSCCERCEELEREVHDLKWKLQRASNSEAQAQALAEQAKGAREVLENAYSGLLDRHGAVMLELARRCGGQSGSEPPANVTIGEHTYWRQG